MAKTNKANMFKADREMAVRVADFATFYISRITDSRRHANLIKSIDGTIKGLNNSLGSALDKDAALAAIEGELALKDAENARYKKACEDRAKWVWAEEDVELYKAISAYNSSMNPSTEQTEAVQKAVIAWFKAWGLTTDKDTNLVKDIVRATGGLRMASGKTVVNSGAETWTASRTKADVLKVAYAVTLQYMIKAGTVKPAAIPDDIREAFAPKKK